MVLRQENVLKKEDVNMRILIICLVICILACTRTDRIVYYKYNNVEITRVDRGKATFFYYGHIYRKNISSLKPEVIVDWSSDDNLFGFLHFINDKNVEVLDGGGGEYRNENKNSYLNFKDIENAELNKLLKKLRNNPYENLYQISNNLELEKKRNKAFGSKVHIKIN
jgi:hypothetical protein